MLSFYYNKLRYVFVDPLIKSFSKTFGIKQHLRITTDFNSNTYYSKFEEEFADVVKRLSIICNKVFSHTDNILFSAKIN